MQDTRAEKANSKKEETTKLQKHESGIEGRGNTMINFRIEYVTMKL